MLIDVHSGVLRVRRCDCTEHAVTTSHYSLPEAGGACTPTLRTQHPLGRVDAD